MRLDEERKEKKERGEGKINICVCRVNVLLLSGFYELCTLVMCYSIYVFIIGLNVEINEFEGWIWILGKNEECFFFI